MDPAAYVTLPKVAYLVQHNSNNGNNSNGTKQGQNRNVVPWL